MAYVTISTWKMNEGAEWGAAERLLQEKFMPAARGLGAESAMTVRTGEDTCAIVAVYPDQATRDTAAAKIDALRGDGAKALGSRMTGEMKGEVIASA